jgi:signal transduction histidine kinase
MVGGLVLMTVGGGLVSMLHTFMMDSVVSAIVDSDVEALQAAQELENSLVMQKGYVTYYFQDNDSAWLNELDKYHLVFDTCLRRARNWSQTEEERNILNQIDAQYIRYCQARDKVISLYKEGKKEEGFQFHQSLRNQFFSIIELSKKFKKIFDEHIAEERERISLRAKIVNASALFAIPFAVVLGGFLAYSLVNDILGPIRKLAQGSDSSQAMGADNEVKALSKRLHSLIEDMDQTRTKLKWSREHLLQAEKWAVVGKLAAGVAHSVRNPLTSVKMRLFSMERSLALSSSQKEDFEVISEEIRHIDTIVNNFLEFSRPPKLKMQEVSPSDSVDMSLQLLKHRLESYDVKVEIRRDDRLPAILADPDQLKEVFVNLVVNACEAMVNGGDIIISEEYLHSIGESESSIVIKLSDNGPGVPSAIQEKLFQPFFSTKEEGTGLGLSIAGRIVEQHGGWIDLESKKGQGATFVITLPVRSDQTQENTWDT